MKWHFKVPRMSIAYVISQPKQLVYQNKTQKISESSIQLNKNKSTQNENCSMEMAENMRQGQ